MSARAGTFGDFVCAHCHALVSSAHWLSGVNNRNHCPYCLWSCHLDLYAAGDRLSACKAPMRPVGLTMKRSRNKYQPEARGELMLIHRCTDCNALSINRIAADDVPEAVLAVFEDSLLTAHQLSDLCHQAGIAMLTEEDTQGVQGQLYGHYAELPGISWS
jgi:hypothetical protein